MVVAGDSRTSQAGGNRRCLRRDFVEPVAAGRRLAAAALSATMEGERREFGAGVERAAGASGGRYSSEGTGQDWQPMADSLQHPIAVSGVRSFRSYGRGGRPNRREIGEIPVSGRRIGVGGCRL